MRELLCTSSLDGRRRTSRARRKEREDVGVVVDTLNELLSKGSSSEEDSEELKDELLEVLVDPWVASEGKEGRIPGELVVSSPLLLESRPP